MSPYISCLGPCFRCWHTLACTLAQFLNSPVLKAGHRIRIPRGIGEPQRQNGIRIEPIIGLGKRSAASDGAGRNVSREFSFTFDIAERIKVHPSTKHYTYHRPNYTFLYRDVRSHTGNSMGRFIKNNIKVSAIQKLSQHTGSDRPASSAYRRFLCTSKA